MFLEDLGREVNREALAIPLGLEHTEYEPDQFSGLIYHPAQYKVTLLVFASGNIIIGGTTNTERAKSAVQHLQENSRSSIVLTAVEQQMK